MAQFLVAVVMALLATGLTRAESIGVEFQSANYIPNIRTGTKTVTCTVRLVGADASRVVAARAIVTRAMDDTGAILKQANTPSFFSTSVGRMSGDHSDTVVIESLTFVLSQPGAGATRLESIEGHVELFVPDKDPNTLVVVDPLPPKFGHRIETPSLKAAGITLVVYDKASTEKYRTADGDEAPQQFDAGPWFIAWPRQQSLFPDLSPFEPVGRGG